MSERYTSSEGRDFSRKNKKGQQEAGSFQAFGFEDNQNTLPESEEQFESKEYIQELHVDDVLAYAKENMSSEEFDDFRKGFADVQGGQEYQKSSHLAQEIHVSDLLAYAEKNLSGEELRNFKEGFEEVAQEENFESEEAQNFVNYLDSLPVADDDRVVPKSIEFVNHLAHTMPFDSEVFAEQLQNDFEEQRREREAQDDRIQIDSITPLRGGETLINADWDSLEKGLKYQGKNVLPADFKLTSRFRDGGGSAVFDIETNKASSRREFVVIDAENDPMLQSYVREARELVENCGNCTDRQKVQKITDLILGSLTREGSVERSRNLAKGEDVLLGDVLQQDAAVCRHRSFLFKTIMDSMPEDFQRKVKTAVVRGAVKDPVKGTYGAHAWNTIQIDQHIYLVDLMNPPKHLRDGKESDQDMFPFPEITHAPESGYYFFSQNSNGKDTVYRGGESRRGNWHEAGQFIGHREILLELKDYRIVEDFYDIPLEKGFELKKNADITQSQGYPEYQVALEFIEDIRESIEFLSEDEIEDLFLKFVADSEWKSLVPSQEMMAYLIQGSLNKARAIFNEMKDNDGRMIIYGREENGVVEAHDYTSYVKLQILEKEMNNGMFPGMAPIRIAPLR